MSGFKQGQYTPKNPEKYIGDVDKITYRSSWELEMNKFLDNNPNVLKWGSEVIVVPYIKPTDNRIHKYYVDYYVQYQNQQGEVVIELIEVKPLTQTKAPRKNHKYRLYEQIQYAINISKWQAARKYADDRGWTFRVITEKSIFV